MCALEVELTFHHDHASLRPALDRAAFDRRGVVEQVDVYFDAPHRSFAGTDEALRLRSTTPAGGRTEVAITYKGHRLGDRAKSRVEHRCGVDDAAAVRAILNALGYTVVETVTKRRERYARGDAIVALDRVEGLGAFVEVELRGDIEARDRIEVALERLVAELGLKGAERENRTYLELLLGDNRDE